MSVDAAFPDDDDPIRDEERIADDDTPVEEVTPDQKRGRGRPEGMTRAESDKVSAQMWDEYAGGMTMRQIGDLHGISLGAVHARLKNYRKRLGIEDIEEAKAIDLGRYEALIERIWKRTFEDPSPENVKTLAMLMDQRAKLLGLNAPRQLKVDASVQHGLSPAATIVLDRLAAERGKLERMSPSAALPAPGGDIVEAELVDDPD